MERKTQGTVLNKRHFFLLFFHYTLNDSAKSGIRQLNPSLLSQLEIFPQIDFTYTFVGSKLFGRPRH